MTAVCAKSAANLRVKLNLKTFKLNLLSVLCVSRCNLLSLSPEAYSAAFLTVY